METIIVIILLVLGIILFLVELFLIPGISLAGIAGMGFLGGAVIYAYVGIGHTAGHITLISGLILLGISIWIFVRSKALEKMALYSEIDSKNDPLKNVNVQVGDKGVTVSRLAPMGKVKVNGSVIEAKTNSDFIDPGEEVTVLEVLQTNVLVERKTTDNSGQ